MTEELEWCVEHGARVVAIRHGAAVTADGLRSPADPMFDRFWGLAQEAGVVLTPHDGADATYADLDTFLDPVGRPPPGSTSRRTTSHARWGGRSRVAPEEPDHPRLRLRPHGARPVRAVPAAAGGVHRVRLRLGAVAAGGARVPGSRRRLPSNPKDQFIEHCWVAPFVEQNVDELARHFPVERILFGSDWPHGEGFPEPRDFFDNVANFSLEDQRRIMYENARELTFA